MLKSLFLLLQNLVTTKTQLILENIFLHKQLEIYQRTDPKLNIKRTDRMFERKKNQPSELENIPAESFERNNFIRFFNCSDS